MLITLEQIKYIASYDDLSLRNSVIADEMEPMNMKMFQKILRSFVLM